MSTIKSAIRSFRLRHIDNAKLTIIAKALGCTRNHAIKILIDKYFNEIQASK